MMWHSYILFVGPEAVLARKLDEKVGAALARRGCPEAGPVGHGIRLFAAPSLPCLCLPHVGAALIGDVYGTAGMGRLRAAADPVALARDIGSGTAIFDRFWGSFIGVMGQGDRAHIVRSLSVALPCYVLCREKLLIVTSDCRLLAAIGIGHPTTDPNRVAAFLLAPNMRTSATALAGIDELLPGNRLSGAAGDWQQRAGWSPWRFAQTDACLDNPVSAEQTLRTSITSALRAELDGRDGNLLSLSGGLDSAVVAAAMTDAEIPFRAINFATRQRTGDERIYARDLSAHLGFELVEAEERLDLIDLMASSAAHLPRPCARAFAQSSDKQQRAFLDERGASAGAFVHGGGGDSIFAYLRSARPVIDAWLDRGLGQAWRTACDLSAVTEAGIVETIRGALRFLGPNRRRYRWPVDHTLLTPDTRSASLPPRHHWLEPPVETPPGKILQVAFTLGIQNRLEGYLRERDRPNIAPLLAQPVIETSLRIPTWMWSAGGINRAVARAAFADRLPRSVRRRTSKGTPGSLLFELIDERRAQIRAMLLEGHLARAGLLDRPTIEARLAQSTLDPLACGRLMTLVDVEAWASSWQSDRSSRA